MLNLGGVVFLLEKQRNTPAELKEGDSSGESARE
jgi:hypothetical protein